MRSTRAVALTALPLSIALLTGCSTASPAAAPSAPEQTAAAPAEVGAPRIAVTVPGGIAVLDAATLEPRATLELDGFLRLSAAGDERAIVVSAPGGFRVLDTGVDIEAHGDHEHYYGVDPTLGDVRIEAEHPGHVTVHGGVTTLFDDGTGTIASLPSADVRDPAAEPELRQVAAHHGVAIELEDGSTVTTEGDADARSSVVALAAEGAELARIDACPGVHGETVAADEAVLLGCEDGAVILRDGAFHHVDAPDDYARIGNVRGHHDSAVVLGDYKVDRDAELERPTRVSLIDTQTGELRLVELGTSYSFRSLARGPHGEALVLGTDGAIHVIDPESGEVTERIPAVAPWEEPLDWQQPRPTLVASGHMLYVTEPAQDRVLAIDAHSGAVVAEAVLDGAPNELAAVR